MILKDITPSILTHNEEANIERVISRLKWASRIIVVDSFSTDSTLDILRKHQNVEIYKKKFNSFHEQCEFGIEKVKTEWAFPIEADYIISDEFIKEISSMPAIPDENGFWVRRIFCIDGVPLRCSILPSQIVLFRKDKAVYYQDGHGHRPKIDGMTGMLKNPIYHDDRKPFKRWLANQEIYSSQEAKKITQTAFKDLRISDKLRRTIIFMPFIMPIYILLLRGGIFEGKRAFYYAYLRTYYEIMLSSKIKNLTFNRPDAARR